jgi:predicted HicB family RNase H-like nuclease
VSKKPAPSTPPAEPPRDRVDLRIDPRVRERLEQQATRFGLDLSGYIRLALIQKLEQDESTDPARACSD